MLQLVEDINDDPEVRLLLITGAGDKAFSAGLDQTEHTSGGAIDPDAIRKKCCVFSLVYSETRRKVVVQ